VSGLEQAAIAGWPLALAAGALLVRERARAGRSRGALNRALHELRRPMQALTLTPSAGGRNGAVWGDGDRHGSLELALLALDDLDREINGGEAPVRLRPVLCRPWVEGSLGRWRVAAGRLGSPVELRWRAGAATVLADPRRLAQALDNLIVNAIEHGGPPIRVEGSRSADRVRIAVLDRGCSNRAAESGSAASARAGAGAVAGRWRIRGGRGHGLEVAARIAAQHGGRFMVRRGPRGTVAALELPLAGIPAVAAASPAVG
jgi:signal transduction histidine kinase